MYQICFSLKMTGCAAVNCSNRSEQGYIMKVFPTDPKRKALWAAKVKRLNWKPTSSSYLCEVSDLSF